MYGCNKYLVYKESYSEMTLFVILYFASLIGMIVSAFLDGFNASFFICFLVGAISTLILKNQDDK